MRSIQIKEILKLDVEQINWSEKWTNVFFKD